MNDIASLQPHAVWHWFRQICAIPHATYHERTLAQYLLQQAQTIGKEFSLTGEMDAKGNVRLHKPASAGNEFQAAVILQAHCDMVAQKSDASTHDFDHDPIEAILEDGWVHAKQTTLGADNGIGLAMALAVLFSHDIPHPELQLIITCEEETRMGGARELSPQWLNAPFLLNLDSEEEGQLFIGCAGGCNVSFTRQFDCTTVAKDNIVRVQLSGLHGGHSGIEIHKGFANANLLLNRLLSDIYAILPFSLISLDGGTVVNAIARNAQAVLCCDDAQTLIHTLNTCWQSIQNEWQTREGCLKMVCTHEPNATHKALSLSNTQTLLDFLTNFPDGVARMSDDFVGVVETSINAGVISLSAGKFMLHTLARSLVESQKDILCTRLAALSRLAGMHMNISDDYPGWEPDPHSVLLDIVRHEMTTYFGSEPVVHVIHAGLECGFLKAKAPNTDMVSFGPTILGAHSPSERVNVDSVARNFGLLCHILAAIPARKEVSDNF